MSTMTYTAVAASEISPTPISSLGHQHYHESLQHGQQSSRTANRPVLHHLNADSSWLLQLPISASARSSDSSSVTHRRYWNILIDPWLRGSQCDVASWFSRQWHAEESKIQSVAAVSGLAWEIEDESAHDDQESRGSAIDLVIVSHEFTDHCHQDTLLEVDPAVLVLAPEKAARYIRAFDHFEQVVDIESWPSRPSAGDAMPSWLNVSRIQKPGDSLYLHAAVVIAFKDGDGKEECVIYTPHGVEPEVVAQLKNDSPEMQPLCLMHGLHDVWLTMAQQLNLGGYNGLQVQRTYKSKYWVGTHDEIKENSGLVGWFLNRKVITLEDAYRQESEKLMKQGESELKDVQFEMIANGGRKVLS